MIGIAVALTAVLGLSLGASLIPCPESCRCQGMTSESIWLECSSLDFLDRLLPKQINGIVSLNISGISLEKVDSRLKLLKNLETLDVSNNKIASISNFPSLGNLKYVNLKGNQLKDIGKLPLSLRSVDISSNAISQITKDWVSLKNLEHLDLNKNPIDCTCETVLYYDNLVEMGVHFGNPLRCSSPKTFRGKKLDSLNCSMIAEVLLNSPTRDQAPLDEHVIVNDEENDFEDHDYIADDGNINDNSNSNFNNDKETEEFEGSGEEGSGHVELIENDKEEEPVACHENCSTLAPIGVNDEDGASPPPSLSESARILFEDISGKSDKPEEKPQVVETPIQKHHTQFDEHTPIKEEEADESNENAKSDSELFQTKGDVPGEMERAVIGSPARDSNMTYYVLGGILVVFIALIVVVIIRKRGQRNKRSKASPKENGHYEEMKPLNSNGKPVENDQIVPKTPENTPLIGEENGKIKGSDPFKQASNTEPQNSNLSDVNSSKFPETDHQFPKSDTLKVTIKASELPDSIPKTPILVQRQLNNDGNYTTTFQSSP